MTERTTRRATLSTIGAGVLGTLSGCAAFGAQSDERSDALPRLDEVYVSNHHPKPQTINVLIERGDEIAYWNTFEVQGLNEEENVAHGKAIEPPSFPRKRADWWISARLGGQTTGTRVRMKTAYPPGCYRIMVRVTPGRDLKLLYDSPSCSTTSTTTG